MTYRINGIAVTREEFMKGAKGFDYSTKSAPCAIFDRADYISPLSGKRVSSRKERREEMKKFECREVDPGEYKARKEQRLTQPRDDHYDD